MKFVSNEALRALRYQRDLRDLESKVLGNLLLEFERKRKSIERKYHNQIDELDARLGALWREFERQKNTSFTRIEASEAAQSDIGREAMRSRSIDPDEPGKDFTIDLNNGTIMHFVDGAYRPVE